MGGFCSALSEQNGNPLSLQFCAQSISFDCSALNFKEMAEDG